MSRYIDADAIKDLLMEYIGLTNGFDRAFSEAPSIDIVHCRECIHYGRDSERNTYGCNLHSIGMTPSDYCSYGERKESE